MTDLKTLKDFETFEISNKVGTNEKIVYSKDLRQEAIRWIKHCSYESEVGRFQYKCKVTIPKYKCIACKRTMEMNNISEEDLK